MFVVMMDAEPERREPFGELIGFQVPCKDVA